MPFDIQLGDLSDPAVVKLLEGHVAALRAVSPPESCHVLDLDGLRSKEVSFYCVRSEGALAGCGALKTLNPRHGEIKSMRTAETHLRRGVAAAMLRFLVEEARRRGITRLSLETGAMEYFVPARKLYRSFGFEVSGPFEGYVADPNSIFMTLRL